MKFAKSLTANRVVLGCLCVGALAALGCAGGPTSPSASAGSGTAATASGTLASSASSPIRPLLVRKTCDTLDHCTVVESVTGPIPVDTEAFYPGPLLVNRTTSAVIITTPSGDTATGNCSLSYKTGLGTCVFTRGTGALAGFHAQLKVTSAFPPEHPDGIFTWDGTYHFSPSK